MKIDVAVFNSTFLIAFYKKYSITSRNNLHFHWRKLNEKFVSIKLLSVLPNFSKEMEITITIIKIQFNSLNKNTKVNLRSLDTFEFLIQHFHSFQHYVMIYDVTLINLFVQINNWKTCFNTSA